MHFKLGFARQIAYDASLYVANNIVANVPSHGIRSSFLARVMKWQIGADASVHMGVRLYCRGQVEIGAHSVIDRDCVLDGRGWICIGENVNLAPETMILTASHDPDDGVAFSGYESMVSIGDHAWIATRAIILPGVEIGSGAVVAAGSVVTTNVPPNAIVAGNPARVIRDRLGCPPSYVLAYKRRFH